MLKREVKRAGCPLVAAHFLKNTMQEKPQKRTISGPVNSLPLLFKTCL